MALLPLQGTLQPRTNLRVQMRCSLPERKPERPRERLRTALQSGHPSHLRRLASKAADDERGLPAADGLAAVSLVPSSNRLPRPASFLQRRHMACWCRQG